MEAIRTQGLTFTYPGAPRPALRGVSLGIEAGSFVTLCGPSGSGKTTLLRQFKSALAPCGARQGDILLEGEALEHWDRRAQAEKVGFVFQSPDSQIVTDKVWHELAFGLESLGYDRQVIRLRVAEMAAYFGIQEWFHRDVAQLSGGQKQLLNLAAVMTMHPRILLLDEPTSQLDPIAAQELLETVARLNRETGVTVLMTEQRLEQALPLSDRVVVMDGGAVVADAPPGEVGKKLWALGHRMFAAMPAPVRIWRSVGGEGACPVTVREGRRWLTEYSRTHALTPPLPQTWDAAASGPAALELEGAWFRYERDGADVVKDLSFTAYCGQITAILGGNGAGKSTLLCLLAGLLTPDRGELRPGGQGRWGAKDGREAAYLPQEPQALFIRNTVEQELREMLSGRGLSGEETARRLEAVGRACRLEELWQCDPRDLSGGELQRAALGKLLVREPGILLLDEPTKGLDATFKEELAGLLSRLREDGTCVVMVSHDLEFCARCADRCALLFDGQLVSQGPPELFFAGNSFYTTAAARMCRELLPGVVTVPQAIAACGGTPPRPAAEEAPPPRRAPAGEAQPAAQERPTGQKRSWRATLAAVCLLLLIPATIWWGMTALEDRRYNFVAVLVVLEAMLALLFRFEGRRPQPRELAVLAALCAVTVASRLAFFWAPQVKPVTALVILTGVAFGGEWGFLVGAVSAFVSNFYFMQGPWTPWQMFAWGLIGLLAGLLFRRGPLRRSRIALCLYGGVATLVIYGGIMNTWDVLFAQGAVTLPLLAAACLRGAPMDLVHAGATVLFLFLGARPMLEKLERVGKKYALG